MHIKHGVFDSVARAPYLCIELKLRRVAKNAEKTFEKPCELSVSAVLIVALPMVMST